MIDSRTHGVAATKAPHGRFYNHVALHEAAAALKGTPACTLVFAVERSQPGLARIVAAHADQNGGLCFCGAEVFSPGPR